MKDQYYNRFLHELGSYIGRLSIQRRITAAILVTFIVILPTISLSLFYFSNLLTGLTIITDQDVRLGRMATDLSLTMLDTRRYERNYRMFGGQTELENVEKLIAYAESVVVAAREISMIPEDTIINDLSGHLEIYSNSFSTLVDYISQNPPENRIQQKTRLSKRLQEFQSAYRNIIKELNEATIAERDSILARANKNLDIFSLDLLTLSDQPGQPAYIQENLDWSSQAFLDKAHLLAERSWAAMQTHKQISMQIEARAKRNIISVLIVTGIVCIFMIVFLPRFIVHPITSLNKILRKAQTGDFKAYAPIKSNDEIGDLAHSYNLMLERLRIYDDLKTRKIASQKRAFDRLLENLDIPACIVMKDMVAAYYNAPFAAIFGPSVPIKAPEGGLDIKQVQTMNSFVESLRKKTADSANNFTLAVSDQNGMPVKMKGRLVRNPLMEIESIVLVGVSEIEEEV